MKTFTTAKQYEVEFKRQTGFEPGDPEPTAYEQVAGWMSAVDEAFETGRITQCTAKFIRRRAAEFVRDEFHARLTPAALVRMVEMGENAQAALEEETFNNALRGLLGQTGLSDEEIDAMFAEANGPVEVPLPNSTTTSPWPQETA